MEDITRRSFVKGAAIGVVGGYFATSGITSSVFKNQVVPPKQFDKTDIGQLKSVKVKVVTETAWFENAVFVSDMQKAGGSLACQWEVPWTQSNMGGYLTYIEAELLDGTIKRMQLDTGWSVAWTDECMKREGIDQKLKNKEIDFLVMSHEHEDHYYGLQSTLNYYPDIPMYVPKGFYQEGFDFMKGKSFPQCNAFNEIEHTGPLTVVEPGTHKLFDGAALVNFDIPIMLRARGEQAFVFNVKDKGLVLVTGCCHMGIITFLEYAKNRIVGGEKIYGIQGGLHVSPFEDWDPQFDDLIRVIHTYGVEKMGCNHCTGYITVEKMLAVGLPVVKGTAQFKSKRDIYLGNGDSIEF